MFTRNDFITAKQRARKPKRLPLTSCKWVKVMTNTHRPALPIGPDCVSSALASSPWGVPRWRTTNATATQAAACLKTNTHTKTTISTSPPDWSFEGFTEACKDPFLFLNWSQSEKVFISNIKKKWDALFFSFFFKYNWLNCSCCVLFWLFLAHCGLWRWSTPTTVSGHSKCNNPVTVS